MAVARERFKAGDIPELDLNLAEVELARAEGRVLDAERERIPLRIKIAALTGLNDNEIQLSDKIALPPTTVLSQDLVKQALIALPDLLTLTRERCRQLPQALTALATGSRCY